MTALWLIVLCGALAILYAIWAIHSVLAADAGTARMQEISAAVAKARRPISSASTPRSASSAS